jgi:diguanylate cyclase (GGDEF)-like protein
MGNQVLRDVAHALQRNCREYDYVARMGGDEFVLVLPGLPTDAVEARVRHLSRTIADAAEESCPGCGVTLSTGQARYPSEGMDPETILAAADSRMYAAKQRRRVSSGSRGYDFDAVSV